MIFYIHLLPVPAYRHAWNAVAERFFDTLFYMIRSMIEALHLPGYIGNYAVVVKDTKDTKDTVRILHIVPFLQ